MQIIVTRTQIIGQLVVAQVTLKYTMSMILVEW